MEMPRGPTDSNTTAILCTFPLTGTPTFAAAGTTGELAAAAGGRADADAGGGAAAAADAPAPSRCTSIFSGLPSALIRARILFGSIPIVVVLPTIAITSPAH